MQVVYEGDDDKNNINDTNSVTGNTETLLSALQKACHPDQIKAKRILNILKQQHSDSIEDFQQHYIQLLYNLRVNRENLQSYTADELFFMDDDMLARGTQLLYERKQRQSKLKTLNEILSRDQHENEMDSDKYAPIVSCNRCKSSDIELHTRQLRSADEPMTIFCTCTKCGTKWKMS